MLSTAALKRIPRLHFERGCKGAGTYSGVVMQDSLDTNCSTQGDISPTLPRDIHNGPLSNYVTARRLVLAGLEPASST
ncbi:hypothetical protein F2P81_017058 [Scophthalmus maximus]|nr:hypothetical protein F2P81_017058 [Scophthalmus maximus]